MLLASWVLSVALAQEAPPQPAAAGQLAGTAAALDEGASYLEAASAAGVPCDGSLPWAGSTVRVVEMIERYSRAWKDGQKAYDDDWQWAYHLLNDGPWLMREHCAADLPPGVATWGGYGFNCPQGSMDVTIGALRDDAASYRRLADVVRCVEGKLPSVVAALREASPPPAPQPSPAEPAPVAPPAPAPAPEFDLAAQLERDRAFVEAATAPYVASAQAMADMAPQIAAAAADMPTVSGRVRFEFDLVVPMLGVSYTTSTPHYALPLVLGLRYFHWFNDPDWEKRSNGIELYLDGGGAYVIEDDPLVSAHLGARVWWRWLGGGLVMIGSSRLEGPAAGLTLAVGGSRASRAGHIGFEGTLGGTPDHPYASLFFRGGAVLGSRMGIEVADGELFGLIALEFRLTTRAREAPARRTAATPRTASYVPAPAGSLGSGPFGVDILASPDAAALVGTRVVVSGQLERTGDATASTAPPLPGHLRKSHEVWWLSPVPTGPATPAPAASLVPCVVVPRTILQGVPIRSAGTWVTLTGTVEATGRTSCPHVLVTDRID